VGEWVVSQGEEGIEPLSGSDNHARLVKIDR